MQYLADCTESDCDHYFAGPHASEARNEAKTHSVETDHVVRFSGRYDSPPGAGYYEDGERLDLDDREKYELSVRR